MEIFWTLAHPLYDIDDVVTLGQKLLDLEGSCLKTDPNVFRHQMTMIATNQIFDKTRDFFAVARNDKDELLGYCVFDRGGYTAYSRDEISNAKFHHCAVELSPRTRIKLIDEMIDQHLLWANKCGIPVVCSTSIKTEHSVFMRLHERRGFVVNGSYAWIRTEDGMKQMNQRVPKG